MENTTEASNHLDKFEKYLCILKGLAPSSVKSYLRHAKEFITWRDGNVIDSLVTRQGIEGFLEFCYYRGNGNSTRSTKLTSLKNYCRYLRYAGVQADDPTADLPRPRATRPFMLTFSRDEILKMFAVCNVNSESGLRDVVFLILGAFAGFRVSEIAGFNIEQVQDDGKNLDLVIPKTKRGAGRSTYLWKAPAIYVRQLLAARLAAGARIGDPLLIGYFKGGRPRGNNCRLTAKAFDNLIKRLAQQAKLRKPQIKCHMLRGSHACDLQAVRGYTMPSILERMGWQNLETAARYLTQRKRLHHEYASLHIFWKDFSGVWTKGDSTAESNQAE